MSRECAPAATPTPVLPPSNPFATRFVRPGAIPFIFPSGVSAPSLVARLAELDWRAAIIGSHGSGKSTLLTTLAPELERVGRRVISISLHDGQRSLPADLPSPRQWSEQTILTVDGYEQLSRISRWQLVRKCRRSGAGLLMTSHSRLGFPVLLQTEVNQRLFEQIVERLLGHDQRVVSQSDMRAIFDADSPNIREALFSLYDYFED